MSLNPASHAHSAIDIIDGTVSEFYNVMDECIRKSEVMPGMYKTITSPSYSNNCPIAESSFTNVDIGCPAPQIIDIDNSFITAEINVPITIPSGFTVNNNASAFFVGWKSSLDAIGRYIIYCNHKVVYDQVYVGEESFILQSLIPEHVRCRKPQQYTTYDNASSFSENVCGTYVILSTANDDSAPVDIGEKTFTVKIPIKIDISQFLLFQNFKYLPGFCGKWTIRLYPSTQNIIFCAVNPRAVMSKSDSIAFNNINMDDYSHYFVQRGDKLTMLTKYDKITKPIASSSVEFKTVTLDVGKCTVDNVLLHQTQFELMYDIYDSLKSRYMQRPLTIPVNKLDYGRFSGHMGDSQTSSTYTAAISNVESLFILPFIDDNHHTVCVNPMFENLYMNISGYGNYPQQPFDTYGNDEKHMRFINMTLDALNINNSPIMAPNKDLMNSLENDKIHFNRFDGVNVSTFSKSFNNNRHDISNFIIGIPFSNDIDFQGGLTSYGNINIKLSASSSQISKVIEKLTGEEKQTTSKIGATVMMCKDCALMIKPIPYVDQPECRLIDERIV